MSTFAGTFAFQDSNAQAAAQTALGLGSFAYIGSLAFSALTSKPTTLAGYGITDNVTTQGNTFNGASQLVQLNSSSQLPAVSGTNLTSLNASNISSGTIAATYLPSSVAQTNVSNTFTAAQHFASVSATGYSSTGFSIDGSGNLTALSLTGNGAGITSINGANIQSSTIPVSALNASGASSSTFLRGDGVFTTPLPSSTAYSVLGNITGTATTATSQQTIVLGTPGFVATSGTVSGQLTGNVNNYLQFAIQNTDAAASSSTDFVVTSDAGNDSTNYGDFGINSSVFSGSGPFSVANGVYLYAQTGNLAIGTVSSQPINLATNNTTQLSISSAGALTVTAFSTAGVVTNNSSGLLASSATLPTSVFPALTGDVTNTAGSLSTTVGKINGTSLAGLATGLLKNTTSTGVPTIAVAGTDYISPSTGSSLTSLPSNTAYYPTLNQSTTGSAASFTGSLSGDVTGTQSSTTVGKINGVSFASLATGLHWNTTTTGVPSIATSAQVASALTGATGTLNLSGTTLTIPTLVVGQGGTGQTTLSANSLLLGNGTSGLLTVTNNASNQTKYLASGVISSTPAFVIPKMQETSNPFIAAGAAFVANTSSLASGYAWTWFANAHCVDSSHNWYGFSSNSSNVSYSYKITPSGTVTQYATSGLPSPFGPTCCVLDSSNNIYVAGLNTTYSPVGTTPYCYKVPSGGGAASSYSSSLPTYFQIMSLVLDSSSVLYQCGFNNSTNAPLVYKTASGGGAASSYITSGLPANMQINNAVIDSSGNLYLCGNSSSYTPYCYKAAYNASTTTAAAYATSGLPSNFLIGGSAFDPTGNLWLVGYNQSNSAPLIYTVPSGGGAATQVLVTGLPTTYNICQVAIDGLGNVCVTAHIGSGANGYIIPYGQTIAVPLLFSSGNSSSNYTGVVVDNQGNFYIAESSQGNYMALWTVPTSYNSTAAYSNIGANNVYTNSVTANSYVGKALPGATAGTLAMSSGSTTGSGGSITTSGGTSGSGGSINTSGSGVYGGGNITTASSGSSGGGSINTSGGGNITMGAGSLTTGAGNLTGPSTSGYILASVTGVSTLTGTPSSTTYARGDGTWSALSSPVTGTTTNNNAATGVIGEYQTSTLATGSSISLTTATAANVVSVSLTAGDWDVRGVVDYTLGTSTATTYMQQGISVTSATLGSQDTYSSYPFAMLAGADAALTTPTVRISLASTTTVYLVAKAAFTVSTLKAYGSIFARRVW